MVKVVDEDEAAVVPYCVVLGILLQRLGYQRESLGRVFFRIDLRI